MDGLDLNQVGAFVRVLEAGSFTAAARSLGLPKSSVSRRVGALERALRVRLLQRSTRRLVPTEAGRVYFERARAALAGLADASAAVTDMSREIAGGVLLLSGFFVPLALALLAPVIVNIVAFHLVVLQGGLGIPLAVLATEIILVRAHRAAFSPMLHARTPLPAVAEPHDQPRELHAAA